MDRRQTSSWTPSVAVASLAGVFVVVASCGVLLLAAAETRPVSPAASEPDRTQLEQKLIHCQLEAADAQGRLTAAQQALESAQQELQELQKQTKHVARRHKAAECTATAQDDRIASTRAAVARVEDETRPHRDRLADLHGDINDLEAGIRDQARRPVVCHWPTTPAHGRHELIFECKQGRVTFADVPALLEAAWQSARDLPKSANNEPERTGAVGPVGAFRLRYAAVRQLAGRPELAIGDSPGKDNPWSYRLTHWELIADSVVRGETVSQALAPDSAFRQVVDGANRDQVTLTLCVYPDSFSAFRTLRDYLVDRGFVVTGRPLPADVVIFGVEQ